MSLQIELLESSFKALAPRAEELTGRFYTRLFDGYPQLRPMFPEDLSGQKKKLAASLGLVVANLRKPDVLREALGALGVRHIAYGTKREHYPIVGEVLLASMAEIAGELWSPELEQAWADAYGAITSIIFEALDEHERAEAA